MESIPAGLFAKISGSASYMFNSTFQYCSSLQSIPSGLFSGVTTTNSGLFSYTFQGCTGLKSIPSNLFENLSGAMEAGMLKNMFYGCTSLTGESAKIGTQFLYKKWPDATTAQVGGCYSGATGLTDYSSIPTNWK
ncbi:hypothetical protein HDR66_03860 [bacterium]|nr:hypothetical protein [bacterium]